MVMSTMSGRVPAATIPAESGRPGNATNNVAASPQPSTRTSVRSHGANLRVRPCIMVTGSSRVTPLETTAASL